MQFEFKKEYNDVIIRKQMSEKLMKQNPGKIPIICEKAPKSKLKKMDKSKFLVPRDFVVSQFNLIIRTKIELNSEEALYLLAIVKHSEISIVGETRLGDIYERYANKEDGFLYIVYAEELFKGSS